MLDDWERGDEWTRWGLEWMHNLDKHKRKRWRLTLRHILAQPADQRPPMCMRRVSGQRWSASNTLDAEQRIFDAVMAMRHRRLPVTIKQLRALAIKFSVRQSFKASAKFALSFMRRWRLSQRARTTTKDISSARVLKASNGLAGTVLEKKLSSERRVDQSIHSMEHGRDISVPGRCRQPKHSTWWAPSRSRLLPQSTSIHAWLLCCAAIGRG